MKFNKQIIITISLVMAVIAGFFAGPYSPFIREFGISEAGLIFVPLMLLMKKNGQKSARFLFPAALSIILYLIIYRASLLYLAVFYIVFFIIEYRQGRLNNGAFFIPLVLAPYTGYFLNVFGFPVRMELTEISAQILSFIGYISKAVGNIIYINNQSFSVDPACMGLKMVVTTFIAALVFAALHEKKGRISGTYLNYISIFTVSFILVIIANIARMIFLIIFESPAGSASHEIIGIACLILLTFIPLYLIIPRLPAFNNFEFFSIFRKFKSIKLFSKDIVLNISGILLVISSLYLNISYRPDNYSSNMEIFKCINMPGYAKSLEKFNITKLENKEYTIFIKPVESLFASYHDPMVCWKASGYSISNEKEMEIGNMVVYTAMLSLGNTRLHTAWWFDNGESRTISQFEWRYEMIKGSDRFNLINVTAGSRKNLMSELLRISTTEIL